MTLRVTGDIDFSDVGKVDASALDVGFFATATYPDDEATPVAEVAATHEFGSPVERIPERPFFRQAVRKLERTIPAFLAQRAAQSGFNLTRRDAELVGQLAVAEVQQSIIDLRDPPNSPQTIERKGSSNPLIDTGVMVGSVGHEVVG